MLTPCVKIFLEFVNYMRYEKIQLKSWKNFEPKWWREKDLNLRTLTRADLQSAAIDHSATSPFKNYKPNFIYVNKKIILFYTFFIIDFLQLYCIVINH